MVLVPCLLFCLASLLKVDLASHSSALVAVSDSANVDAASQPSRHVGRWIFFIALVGLVAALAKYGHSLLGRAIEAEIEDFDKKLIGVDIDIGSLDLALFSGRVEMKGMMIQNPPGWTEPYVFKVDKILFDIDMMSIIKSRGKIIEVTAIKINGLDAIVEFEGRLPRGKSNVQDILDFVAAKTDKEKPSEAAHKKKVEEALKKGEQPPEKPSHQIIVHRLQIEDLGARVATSLAGSRFAVGDVDFPDFSKDGGAYLADDIVCLIVKTLTKTILTNITGEGFANWLM